jgi:hypothetical protein
MSIQIPVTPRENKSPRPVAEGTTINGQPSIAQKFLMRIRPVNKRVHGNTVTFLSCFFRRARSPGSCCRGWIMRGVETAATLARMGTGIQPEMWIDRAAAAVAFYAAVDDAAFCRPLGPWPPA